MKNKNTSRILVFLLSFLFLFVALSHSSSVFSSTMWTLTEVVSTESSGESRYPSIAVDDFANVHIVWLDYSDYDSAGIDMDIFYKSWNNNSQTWTTTEVLSTDCTNNSTLPSVAADYLGNVHVVWGEWTDILGAGVDMDIFYRCWNESLSTWTPKEVISIEGSGNSSAPAIATDTLGNVHIAWGDNHDYLGSGSDKDVFYRFWDRVTSSWNQTEVVSTESTDDSYHIKIAVSGTNKVYFLWSDDSDYDNAGTDPDIFYKFFNSTSKIWNQTEVLTPSSSGMARYPSLGVDSYENVHTTWMEFVSAYSIYYRVWNATLESWSTTLLVSSESTSLTAFEPELAVDSLGNAHVVWGDDTNIASSGSDYDIFYKFWNATTDSWISTQVISTESTDDCYSPCIAIDSQDQIHLSWWDLTDYDSCDLDYDIFYKRLIEAPLIPEFSAVPYLVSISIIVCMLFVVRRIKRKIA